MHGNWYGTPRDQVQSAVAAGHDAILKIDVQGAHKVRQKVKDALLIFVVPPSLEALHARLVGRHTESPADLERRRADAEYELSARRPTTTTSWSTRRTRSTARPRRSTPSSRPSTPATPTAASSCRRT